MRVYDTKENKWMPRDEFFLTCYGDLYHVEKGMFGYYKMNLVSPERYVTHSDTGFNDKNGTPIFEGDICDVELTDEKIRCVVAYVVEQATYCLFDDDNSKYYTIGSGIYEAATVVGNVFDGVKSDDPEE